MFLVMPACQKSMKLLYSTISKHSQLVDIDGLGIVCGGVACAHALLVVHQRGVKRAVHHTQYEGVALHISSILDCQALQFEN